MITFSADSLLLLHRLHQLSPSTCFCTLNGKLQLIEMFATTLFFCELHNYQIEQLRAFWRKSKRSTCHYQYVSLPKKKLWKSFFIYGSSKNTHKRRQKEWRVDDGFVRLSTLHLPKSLFIFNFVCVLNAWAFFRLPRRAKALLFRHHLSCFGSTFFHLFCINCTHQKRHQNVDKIHKSNSKQPNFINHFCM